MEKRKVYVGMCSVLKYLSNIVAKKNETFFRYSSLFVRVLIKDKKYRVPPGTGGPLDELWRNRFWACLILSVVSYGDLFVVKSFVPSSKLKMKKVNKSVMVGGQIRSPLPLSKGLW